MKKTVLVRLVNGEELISELESNENGYVTLYYPLVVSEYTNPENGNESIVLNTYLPFTKSKIACIKAEHIICLSEVEDSTVAYYRASIQLNEKLLEKQVNDKIQEAADQLNNYLQDLDEPTVIPQKRYNDSKIISFPSSNTVH